MLRYDARRFRGPDSERELDTCLAVMSTSDLPWTFRVWDHLGGEVLRSQLERRGFPVQSASTAVWLDLPGPVLAPMRPRGTQLRGSARRGTCATGPRCTARCSRCHPPPRCVDVPPRTPSSFSLLAVLGGRPCGVLSMASADGVAVLYHSACCPAPGGRASGRLLVETGLACARARGMRACVAVALVGQRPTWPPPSVRSRSRAVTDMVPGPALLTPRIAGAAGRRSAVSGRERQPDQGQVAAR